MSYEPAATRPNTASDLHATRRQSLLDGRPDVVAMVIRAASTRYNWCLPGAEAERLHEEARWFLPHGFQPAVSTVGDPIMKLILFFVLVLVAAPSAPIVAQQAPSFEFTETEQGVLLSEAGKKVLFYQRAPKSIEGKFTRSHYLHPLYGLDGEVLTEDFPADHRHHRGIFWAWHQVWVGVVRAGDPWACRDFQWDVQSVETRLGDDGTAELQARVHWKSPAITDPTGEMRPLVDETAVIRIHPAEADARAIDVSFRLRALVPDLRIGGSDDEKGYGGFSTRIVLPDDLRFVSSAGQVEARTMQVEAGPWMDMVGTFNKDEGVGGLAILCHPTLPGHIQPWILRTRHSMQNAVWPGRHPVELRQDRPLAFNYRLLLHRGDTGDAKVAQRHDAFADETPRLAAEALPSDESQLLLGDESPIRSSASGGCD